MAVNLKRYSTLPDQCFESGERFQPLIRTPEEEMPWVFKPSWVIWQDKWKNKHLNYQLQNMSSKTIPEQREGHKKSLDERGSTWEETPTLMGREGTTGEHGICPNYAGPLLMAKVMIFTHPYVTMCLTLKFLSTMHLSPWPWTWYLPHHQHWQQI